MKGTRKTQAKTLAFVAGIALAASGCQYGATGWHAGPGNDSGHGYQVWTHDPAVANGCNEWDVEPTAEVDNDGKLCVSVLP